MNRKSAGALFSGVASVAASLCGANVWADGHIGERCGGDFHTRPCLPGLVCDRDVDTCNALTAHGMCRPVLLVCPATYEPECGCDGKTSANECERRKAETSLKHEGGCTGHETWLGSDAA